MPPDDQSYNIHRWLRSKRNYVQAYTQRIVVIVLIWFDKLQVFLLLPVDLSDEEIRGQVPYL